MTDRETVIVFAATIPGMADAGRALRDFLDCHELGATRRYQLELTFDEIASNIIRHGQPVTSVALEVTIGAAEAMLTFDDDGVSFDPRVHRPAPRSVPGEDAPLGGHGLALVRTCASRIEYERTPQQHNRLTVAIRLDAA
jgi:anti-sigma regulatory factor (Ser/Thr protein kinase)